MADSSERRSGSSGSVRLSIRVGPEVKDAIDRIQKFGKMNSTADALRRAIGDELFLQEQMNQGWKVLVEKDNVIREVVWPKF